MKCGPTSQLRILVAIASYGTANDHYLARLISEYRSMPFEIDIVVLSNIDKTVAGGVDLRTVDLRGQDPWSLPFAHRTLLADKVDEYDLFIYSEDDILITERNIRAFLRVQTWLRDGEIAGFFRFERGRDGQINYPDVHAHFHWDTGSVRRREQYTLAYFTNEHSGCYLLTQDQLRRAIDSKGFLVSPHHGRYAYPETAATDPYTQCRLQKLLCISQLDDFLVHHLSNKYVESDFGVDEQELRRQVSFLLDIARDEQHPPSLFDTETKFGIGAYSKGYYEPVQPEVVSAIPPATRTVLSIGCGWGSLESCLARKGLHVVAVPLDPVIPGGAQANGVEIVLTSLDSLPTRLGGRHFDCILLCNVLHLIPDPVRLLHLLRDLLSPGAVLIVRVPNLLGLPVIMRRTLRDQRFRGIGNYLESGVHVTSSMGMRNWMTSSGMKVEQTIHVLNARAAKLERLVPGLFDTLLSSELIAVARRDSGNVPHGLERSTPETETPLS